MVTTEDTEFTEELERVSFLHLCVLCALCGSFSYSSAELCGTAAPSALKIRANLAICAGLRRQHDRAEVSPSIEGINTLMALQEVDHRIRQRRGHHFIEYLKNPLDENGGH